MEENALRQKARIKWIQLGDANNKYFSAIIKERVQKKQIKNIISSSGQILYGPEEVKNEFVNFYKGLIGSSASILPAIDVKVIKRAPVLSR